LAHNGLVVTGVSRTCCIRADPDLSQCQPNFYFSSGKKVMAHTSLSGYKIHYDPWRSIVLKAWPGRNEHPGLQIRW